MLGFFAAAWACDVSPDAAWFIDPGLADGEPPAALRDVRVAVSRGEAPRCSGEGCEEPSCLTFGQLSLTAETDEWVGLRVAVVEGALPAGAAARPVALVGPTVSIWWDERNPNAPEPFEVSLEVVPVDRAGNDGPAYVVEVADDGGREVRCASSSGGGWALIGGLVALRRRLRVGAGPRPA